MKSLTLILSTILLTICSADLLVGQETTDKSGTTAAQFLKIGVGAQAMGVGGAFVAATDDVYSLYWNPAGITKVSRVTFAGAYTQWFADITHQFFGLVLPIDGSSAVGFHAIFLNIDPIEITTIDRPHGTGEFFDANDLAVGVSYARRLTNLFAMGITGKYLQQSIYNESAGTFAFDIGSMLDVPWWGIKLGMHFSNFGGKLQLDGRDLIREFDMNPNNTTNIGVEKRLQTEPWELPINFRVGLAADVMGGEESPMDSEINRLSISIDGNHPVDSPEFINLGVEYSYQDLVTARFGYRMKPDNSKLFYGAGLKMPISDAFLTLDYALASYDELDYINIISMCISF